LSAEKLADKL